MIYSSKCYQDVLCEVCSLLSTTGTYACLVRQMWFTQVSVLKIDKQTFPAETRCSEAHRDSQIKNFTEGTGYRWLEILVR